MPHCRSLPLRTLATLAVAALGTGCVHFEANAGYYFTSAKKTDDAAPATADPELDGHIGVGVGVGGYLDMLDDKLRVSVTGAGERFFISAKDTDEGYITANGVQLRVDYMFAEDIAAVILGQYGSGTLAYSGSDGPDARTVGGFAGIGTRRGDASGFFMAALGLRYQSVVAKDQALNTSLGRFSAIGPELRLTVGGDLFGSSSGGGGGGGGGGDSQAGMAVELPDGSTVIPALANGARKKGCSVEESTNNLIARCPEGNIGYIQEGRKLLIVCQKGMSNDQCRSLNMSVADHAR